MSTHVAVAQLDPVLGDITGNIERSISAIADLVAQNADIIVLPELCLTGYMFDGMDEVRAGAMGRSHPLFGAWRNAIDNTDAVVVGGFAESDGDDFYISAAVVTRDGLQAVHRKTHLWNREKLLFTPGDAEPPVVSTSHGRVGVLLCYEAEFPEMPRALALRGADLVAVPTNWGMAARPYGHEPYQVMLMRAAARANHIFLAVCDRRGAERGQTFTAGSTIIDAEGWVVASAGQSMSAIADLGDLHRARDRGISTVNDVFRDRRPELYGALARNTARDRPRPSTGHLSVTRAMPE